MIQKTMRLKHNKSLSVRSFCPRAADQMLVEVDTRTQTPSPPPHQLTLSSCAEVFFMISMGGGSGVCASSSCSSSPPLCMPEDVLERRFPSLLRTLWGTHGESAAWALRMFPAHETLLLIHSELMFTMKSLSSSRLVLTHGLLLKISICRFKIDQFPTLFSIILFLFPC